jgi:hypothetical protein
MKSSMVSVISPTREMGTGGSCFTSLGKIIKTLSQKQKANKSVEVVAQVVENLL